MKISIITAVLLLVWGWQAGFAADNYRSPEEIDPLAGDALQLLEHPRSAYALQGLQLEQAGDFPAAAACYIAALQSDNANYELLFRLAGCYGQLGEGSLAAQALRLAQENGLPNFSRNLADPRFDSVRDEYAFALTADVLRAREQHYEEQMGESLLLERRSFGEVRYFLPDDYDASREYPLLIMLHGASGTAENVAAWRQQMPRTDFILAAPSGAYPIFNDYHPSQLWWPGMRQDDPLQGPYIEQAAQFVRDIAAKMRTEFKVSRVVVAGFSQGGILAGYCVLQHPDEFAGLAAFSTRLPPGLDTEQPDLQLPVFMGHGRYDITVPLGDGNELADYFEELGSPVTRFEFDGGHEISMQELVEFCDWLDETVSAAEPERSGTSGPAPMSD